MNVVFTRVRFACMLAACVYAPLSLGCSDDAVPTIDGAIDDHDHDQDGAVDEENLLGTPTGATCPTGSTLTWENFGEEFMTSYCTSCHNRNLKGNDRNGAPADHDFDYREGVLFVRDHIDRYAGAGPNATNQFMPPVDPKPTEAERRMLAEWIACGVK